MKIILEFDDGRIAQVVYADNSPELIAKAVNNATEEIFANSLCEDCGHENFPEECICWDDFLEGIGRKIGNSIIKAINEQE